MKKLIEKFLKKLGLFLDFKNQIEPDAEVKKGEKVIGEMNDMEKGLYTFIQGKKEKEHEQLIGKLKLSKEYGNKKEELQKLSLEHAKIHRVIDLARKIMWTSIESRFETSEGAIGTGIRKGFKIVETFKDENPSISGMMIPGLGMMISIGG